MQRLERNQEQKQILNLLEAFSNWAWEAYQILWNIITPANFTWNVSDLSMMVLRSER